MSVILSNMPLWRDMQYYALFDLQGMGFIKINLQSNLIVYVLTMFAHSLRMIIVLIKNTIIYARALSINSR
jgi:hypothetical protein